MKINKWTVALAAAGLVTLPSATRADEAKNHLATALESTTISGYVNTSIHWDLGTGNGNNPLYSYGGSSKSDGFNLNVVKLSLEKPLDEGQWAAGYKVDLLFGPDATAYVTSVDGAGDSDSTAIKQAYVQLRAPVGNGLDFKVGVFDTIIGYEVFDAGSNPNYTRSYGYTIEPTAHTGVLMSYQFCEVFSASAGIADTTAPVINQRGFGNPVNNKAESYKTYMGSVAFTVPKDMDFLSGSTVYAGVVNGFNPFAPTGGGMFDGAVVTHWYLGGTFNTPVENLKVGASYDYLGISQQDLSSGAVPSGYAWAASAYGSYQLNEKTSIHGRGEYFSQTRSWGGPSLPVEVLSLTGTLQYDLWKNVLSRLEFRWDHSASGGDAYGESSGSYSSGSPNKKNAYLLAANIIYKF